MLKKITYLHLLLAVFALLVVSQYQLVFAQEGGRSISVVPPKFELFANPGDIVTERLKITNNSGVVSNYSILVEDFGSTGEEGQVVLEEQGADSKYSLAQWIEPEATEIVLEPNEEKNLTFNINVPRDAEPGGHYASILLQSATDPNLPQEGGAAAAVSQRIGSLVLLRVSGNITETANIETFEAPARSQSGPVDLTLRIKNDGNVHVRPKGTIIITNFLGQKVDELPLEGANVLPGATRKMDTTWEKDNLMGSYKATLVATYGQQSLPLTAATKFNVISNTALILIIVIVTTFVIFIVSLFTGRGRLKKAFKALTQG
jgi:hypothetical protein